MTDIPLEMGISVNVHPKQAEHISLEAYQRTQADGKDYWLQFGNRSQYSSVSVFLTPESAHRIIELLQEAFPDA